MDPTVGMCVGFIGAPIDALTMGDITGDTLLTIMEEDTIAPIIMALIVDMCDEFTVEPTDGVITDASLERPPGRAPGIGEPPALACSQGLPGPSPEDLMSWPWALTAPLQSQTLVTVAAAASHGGSLCGPFGGYDGWWFWPRRHH